MRLNPHLNFDGRCEEAFKFYEKCLGGKISFTMSYGDSPVADHVPADWRNKIIHATLNIGNDLLTAADAPPDRYQRPQGFHVTLGLADAAEAERIFKALSENGTVQMPLQETFWAIRFGMVADRFGIPWMVNCSKPM
jgi:PhnB protein